eukprot:181987-Chlamydomonas_euryale.AAC.1
MEAACMADRWKQRAWLTDGSSLHGSCERQLRHNMVGSQLGRSRIAYSKRRQLSCRQPSCHAMRSGRRQMRRPTEGADRRPAWAARCGDGAPQLLAGRCCSRRQPRGTLARSRSSLAKHLSLWGCVAGGRCCSRCQP